MFSIIPVLLVIVGVLLLIKAKSLSGKHWSGVLFGTSGIIVMLYGVVVVYYIISGVIELPL